MTESGKCKDGDNKCKIDTYCPTSEDNIVDCKSCADNLINFRYGCNCIDNVSTQRCQLCKDGTCSVCIANYFLTSTKTCEICDSNCKSCEGKETECTECKPGFILETTSKTCVKSCSNHKDCNAQHLGYCDFSVKHCKPCQEDCSFCTSAIFCLECEGHKAKPVTTIDGKCIAECAGIADGQFCQDGTSTSCSASSTSQCKCANMFRCATCNDNKTQCATCLAGYAINTEGNCTDCAYGYEPVAAICLPLSSSGEGSNFSGGAVAGIVVAVLIVVGAVGGGLAYYFVKKAKK
ncbi:Cysteine-rich membrane protein 1 [Spironucleus salmonicida]|uniref:Cysteine-rich membrane protein 1 n=1 Tax=Spironucleus salmonicida TaxID=348837 RepID=V6LD33_9EUKA|nr:Cysteine-rich membrane protein 1 [Spironucleus salmonicida]|eukprot:EST42405.1 Cysteine-rich membrane protein 1 [Spironucleus salmonicida]